MRKIIYAADASILAVPIIECYEPLIDIKNFTALQYGTPPECELTKECYTKMRKSVFEKICQAQNELPKGWHFKLYEGFRSKKVQQMLFDHEFKRVTMRCPDVSCEKHFYETTRLVSPVINLDGSLNIPPHNTGGAIDIEIINDHGELINMGMAIKDWSHVEPELCLTDCQSINQEVKKNRKILLEAMQKYDFVNYPTEWWHFSYGDRYWAYHKLTTAIYGSADIL
jgi:zinc D-Ala-D-Ala dipeptidase